MLNLVFQRITYKYFPKAGFTIVRGVSSSHSLFGWSGGKPAGRAEKRNRNPNQPDFSNQDEEIDFDEPYSRRKSPRAANMAPREAPDFKNIAPSMRNKFRLFQDETEEVVDSATAQWTVIEAPDEVDVIDEFEGLNLERGKTGVIDIEDLVEVLRLENAVDLCVIAVPPEVKFADYMVVASGRSSRQLIGMAQFIARYYKAKKYPSDPFMENNSASKWKSNWVCLDLGNIILHLMADDVRRVYDIESLWAIGPEHDEHLQTPSSEAVQLVEKHSTIVSQTSSNSGGRP